MKRALGALFGLLLVAGCKDEPDAPPEDAGSLTRTFGATELGVSVILPMGWVVDPVASKKRAATGPTALAPGERVQTVARARRVPGRERFLVAPKLIVTVEPTARRSPELIFRATMEDLKSIGNSDSVEVTRSALSTRFVGASQVGDLEMAYQVRAGDARPQEVVHRSAVVLRRPSVGSRAIVTVTATYMAKDATTLTPEVQAIMNSLTLTAEQATP